MSALLSPNGTQVPYAPLHFRRTRSSCWWVTTTAWHCTRGRTAGWVTCRLRSYSLLRFSRTTLGVQQVVNLLSCILQRAASVEGLAVALTHQWTACAYRHPEGTSPLRTESKKQRHRVGFASAIRAPGNNNNEHHHHNNNWYLYYNYDDDDYHYYYY